MSFYFLGTLFWPSSPPPPLSPTNSWLRRWAPVLLWTALFSIATVGNMVTCFQLYHVIDAWQSEVSSRTCTNRAKWSNVASHIQCDKWGQSSRWSTFSGLSTGLLYSWLIHFVNLLQNYLKTNICTRNYLFLSTSSKHVWESKINASNASNNVAKFFMQI